MKRTLLKSKLHRASITSTDLDYEGSITIDKVLLKEAEIVPYEKVDIYNITNGNRFTTYAIEGKAGEIGINGATAQIAQVGDRIIIAIYGFYAEDERHEHHAKKLVLNKNNEIEKHIHDKRHPVIYS